MNVVIIGGPRSGQGLTIPDDRQAVTLLEMPQEVEWQDGRVSPESEVPAMTYRRERFLIVGVGVVNLLVRNSIPTAQLHEHLAPILTPAAREAITPER